MKFSKLNEMGLYDLNSLIYQLRGLNQAFYAYADNKLQGTDILDFESRNTVFGLINAEETIIAKTHEVADRLTEALEKFKPEEYINDQNKQS